MVFPGKIYGATTTLEVGSGKTYTTIQAAVDAVDTLDLSGDIIITVAAGTYEVEGEYDEDHYEGVKIDGSLFSGVTSIKIKGAGADTTTVKSSNMTFYITGDISVVISGFTITTADIDKTNDTGIDVDCIGNVNIYDNIISNIGDGIDVDSDFKGTVKIYGNEIENIDDVGIYINDNYEVSNTFNIYQNDIKSTDIGIYINSPKGSFDITNNNITDNYNGIYIDQGGDFIEINVNENNFDENIDTDGAIWWDSNSNDPGENNVDAINNWWGDNNDTGPGGYYFDTNALTGSGDHIYDALDSGKTKDEQGGVILFVDWADGEFTSTECGADSYIESDDSEDIGSGSGSSSTPRSLTPDEWIAQNHNIDDLQNHYGATPKGFLGMLYDNSMQRIPDTSGLNYWNEQLTGGVFGANQVAEHFLFSDEIGAKVAAMTNEEYISYLYTTLLSRNSDTDGYNNWLGYLNSGFSKEETLRAFLNNEEWINICKLFNVMP